MTTDKANRTAWSLEEARYLAIELEDIFKKHVAKIVIAGSIRRQRPEVQKEDEG